MRTPSTPGSLLPTVTVVLAAALLAGSLAACTAAASASPPPLASPMSPASSAAPASGAPSASPSAAPVAPTSVPAQPAPTDRPHGPLPPRASLEPTGAPVTGEVPGAVIGRARDLLAATIGAGPAASATVEIAEAVTWPDGSLGCPQPGLFYVQMVTPGYRVVLASEGTRYTFVGSVAGELRACDRPRPGG
jgi:hypothetical protein